MFQIPPKFPVYLLKKICMAVDPCCSNLCFPSVLLSKSRSVCSIGTIKFRCLWFSLLNLVPSLMRMVFLNYLVILLCVHFCIWDSLLTYLLAVFLFKTICLVCRVGTAGLPGVIFRCSPSTRGTLHSFWALIIQVLLQSTILTCCLGQGWARTAATSVGGGCGRRKSSIAHQLTTETLSQDSFLIPCLSSLISECPRAALTFATDFSSILVMVSIWFCQSFLFLEIVKISVHQFHPFLFSSTVVNLFFLKQIFWYFRRLKWE